ncbi:MAG: peptidase M64 [Bacteroidaceae bacterium]|nr:peptidase M64 [Bacteroidaceae bacterium]
MPRILFSFLLLLLSSATSLSAAKAVRYDDWFADATLRLNYILSGTNTTQDIALHTMARTPLWAGRRVNLDKLLLEGNAQVELTDSATGRRIYIASFSTLFQEWQHSEEATQVRKAFEVVQLVPMPLRTAYATLRLYDSHRRTVAEMRHRVSPNDILIRQGKAASKHFVTQLHGGDAREGIDIVYIAEGYTIAQRELFLSDVRTAMEALFDHAPFSLMRDRFNIRAVFVPSEREDVSVPLEGKWNETPCGSHFSTLYSDRYLMTEKLFQVYDLLEGVPTEHVIILANTPVYGGGGIYNLYAMTSARQQWFRPVVVHEFGHSFAGLADEYFYDDQFETFYPAGIEPWEPNLSTLTDFDKKWARLMGNPSAMNEGIGVFEGGGYQSKGVYRPSLDCRMRTNEYPVFCPACREAIEKAIKYNTETIKL